MLRTWRQVRKYRAAVEEKLDKASGDTERKFFSNLLETFDFRGFAKLSQKHPAPKGGGTSWFNLPVYGEIALRQVMRLGLHESSPKLIFDIACGPCYFGFVAQHFGHQVVGLDQNNHEIYTDIASFLGVEFIDELVFPNEPLPKTRKHDLVTAWRASFHTNKKRSFEIEEWTFFLKDLVDNHIKPDGKIFLSINKNDGQGMDIRGRKFAQFIEGLGGTVDGQTFAFDDIGKLSERLK